MDILEIITHITEFIQYFATGLLFFGAYSFAACLPREEQSEYFVVKVLRRVLSLMLLIVGYLMFLKLILNIFR